MKRVRDLFPILISDSNIAEAIKEVNRTHKFSHGRPNKIAMWVELTLEDRIVELRELIVNGFTPKPYHHIRRYDYSAKKWREIDEPALWPDQYVHHMVIQVLQPVMMRGMDHWCCGSIRGRGTKRGIHGINRWMNDDAKNTRYAAELDIHHFYDSLRPEIVMRRMRQLVKDEKMLDVVWRLISGGIRIGAYFSQWFANTTLQPLDHFIRETLHVRHYTRYMDNLTLFGNNKKLLHRAVREINKFLSSLELKLKGNWQVFRTSFTRKVDMRHKELSERKQKFRKPRRVNAMGFMFAQGVMLIRKKNLLRLKRQLGRTYRRIRRHLPVAFRVAAGLISRIGQLSHCMNRNVREKNIKRGLLKYLKRIVSVTSRRRKEFRECLIATCSENLKRNLARNASFRPKGAQTLAFPSVTN